MLHDVQLPDENDPGIYPAAHVAAEHSSTLGPLHSVHAITESSLEKLLHCCVQVPVSDENDPVTYPSSHVAAVHSAILSPVHSVHVSTDGTVEKSMLLHGVQPLKVKLLS